MQPVTLSKAIAPDAPSGGPQWWYSDQGDSEAV